MFAHCVGVPTYIVIITSRWCVQGKKPKAEERGGAGRRRRKARLDEEIESESEIDR